MRQLGMLAEQAGIPALCIPVLIGMSIIIGLFIDAWIGFLALVFFLTFIPWLAKHHTKVSVQPLQGVRLPKNQALTTLYYPGLGNSKNQDDRYVDHGQFPGALGLLINPVVIQPYDAEDFRRFNVAQEGDVGHALIQTRAVMQSRPHDVFVLFGTSRGSAVALQVAQLLTPEEASRVRFMVLEGIFTEARRVMELRFGSGITVTLERFLAYLTEYNPNSKTTPKSVAREFKHKEMPLLLVTSRVDTIVDPSLSDAMYKILSDRVKHSHLLTLEHSPHSSYATWNQEDRALYVTHMQDYINRFV